MFDLDEWALQVLLVWGAGIGALAAFQIIDGFGLHNPALAMLGTLMAFGLLYVPFTKWIWSRFVTQRGASSRELTGGILNLSLSQPADRPERWARLLGETFHARRVEWGPQPGLGGQDRIQGRRQSSPGNGQDRW